MLTDSPPPEPAAAPRRCEICGGPLRSHNTVGVCMRNPVCRVEHQRRKNLACPKVYDTCECGHRKSAKARMCLQCYTDARAGSC